jgi:DNA-binding transcriptional LysR family regulator
VRGSEYAELAAFVAVAKERSFRRAASRLGLSPSALSHTIRELEERLGAKLLNRTTRSVAPTEAGRDLYDRLAPAFADITGAVEAVRAFGEQPSGTVRLNLPKLAAEMILAPALGRFARAYPDVHLELAVDDGLSDIVAAGFDAGIRPGELVQRDMVAVRVTPDLRSAVVGSPGYIALRPAPQTPRDLKDHACINYRFAASGALYRWQFARAGEVIDVAVEGSLTLNDMDLVRTAALDGAGLACTLENSVEGDVAAGRLVRVLDDWCQPFSGFFLYYPGRRQMPSALRVLIDFLAVRSP